MAPAMMGFRAIPLIFIVCYVPAARAVTINWSAVGNPGNAADATGFGAVDHPYNIGTYDVTNSQYVEFLNAKDPTGADPLGLYNANMSNTTFGGIEFNNEGHSGMMYSVVSGRGNHPVNYTTWFDSIRFANWLNNGQGDGDTETGAYTLLGGTPTPSNANSITRTSGATVFLPSESEWYKAAYYDPGTNSYLQYPTGSSMTPTGSSPTALPNHANFLPGGPGNPTDVGAYSGTTSAYGAFDMGGNVFQWNEGLFEGSFSRALRGGAFDVGSGALLPSGRFDAFRSGGDPSFEYEVIGFRVAAVVPEPSSLSLAGFGLAGFASWAWRRKRP